MNLWRCPKCQHEMTQPDCVVFVSHRCSTRTSRTVALQQITKPNTNNREEHPQ